MDAMKHAQISVKRCGGRIEDYFPIHQFLDSTKELCSDNRHRLLHTLWGVRRVVIPIFGPSITNSDGKTVSVKEICEFDHILPDYQNRFIPTLSDFVNAIEIDDQVDWQAKLDAIHQQFGDKRINNLLLSPLALTGQLKSLLVTHNSWFMYEIVPQIADLPGGFKTIDISPDFLFGHMKFELWMDNGAALPPSAKGLHHGA